MSFIKLGLIAAFCSGCALAQGSALSSATLAPQLAPQITLPISFTKSINADHVSNGDPVTARTLQKVRLATGREINAGAQVLGHIAEAQPFAFNKTPYARQKQAALVVQFDSLVTRQGETIPLHVYLRALADTFATSAAYQPRPSDEDPLHSTTQVGGDIVTPSQNEVINQDGDVVGYNKRDGIYAHLIAHAGPGPAHCDASDTEQPMANFSASACGLYGFKDIALTSTGLGAETSSFTLVSTRRSPEIFRGSTALLEVVSTTSMASASH